jgi:hypothetical protein|tara:strand:+ start:271 stop:1491 length:1221 start_codon:yes stop_codon:yes gene_type:complete
VTIGRAQIDESIDMKLGGDPIAEQNKRMEELAAELRGRVEGFDFDTTQQEYVDRLSQFAPQPDKFDIFDLATSISQGLAAQQQGAGPDSIGQGLAMGFNIASADMRERDRLMEQARQEIGLQAAKLAMSDEKAASDFLDKALFELAKQSGTAAGAKDTADISNYEFYTSLDEEGKKTWNKMKNQDPLALFALEEAKRKARSPGSLDLTVGQKKVDEEFGKIMADYVLKGGPQIKSNLKNLEEKIEILEAGDLNVSGPAIGVLGDAAMGAFAPDAASFISDIRDIVFQSLREKLGAQFTEREGNRLVNAAFNQYLDESRNVARLKRLYDTIDQAARSKEAAIAYYEEKGTLQGYTVPTLDFQSIMSGLVQESDFEGMTDEELKEYFANASEDEQEIILEMVRAREEQ